MRCVRLSRVCFVKVKSMSLHSTSLTTIDATSFVPLTHVLESETLTYAIIYASTNNLGCATYNWPSAQTGTAQSWTRGNSRGQRDESGSASHN